LASTVSIPKIVCKRRKAQPSADQSEQIFDLAPVKTYHCLDLLPGIARKLAQTALPRLRWRAGMSKLSDLDQDAGRTV
jgi:hypothetical protein